MSTPHITTATANSTSFVLLRSVTGIGGQLLSVGVAGGTGYHFVRIGVDGRRLVDDYLSGTVGGGPTHTNTSLSLDLPFGSSFEVDVRDDPGASPATRYWCVDMTNGSELVSRSEELFTEHGTELVYRDEVYRTEEGNEYSTRSLVGPRVVSRGSGWRTTCCGSAPSGGRCTSSRTSIETFRLRGAGPVKYLSFFGYRAGAPQWRDSQELDSSEDVLKYRCRSLWRTSS